MVGVPVQGADAAVAAVAGLPALSDALPGAVIAVDLQSRVLLWSRGAEELYGWTAVEALGRSARTLLLEGSEAQADEVRARALTGRSWEGEFTTRRKDGSTLQVYVANAPLLGPSGEVVGVLGVSLDMSRHVAAMQAREAELQAARERAERLADRNRRLVLVSEALAAALTAEQVVDVVLGQGVTALEVEAGAVLSVVAERLHVLGTVGYEQSLVQHYEGLGLGVDTPLTDVVRQGRTAVTGTAQDLHRRWPDMPHSRLSSSYAGVPLAVDGVVLGVMALSSTREGAFPPEEVEFLETLGRQCAQALQRGRLFEAAEQASARAQFLARASERLSASLDYHETLDAVAALAVPGTADWCSVHLLDEQGQPQLVGVHHKDPERLEVLRALFERYPPQVDRGAGVGQAVGEARLVHHRTFPEAALRAIARDEEHLEGLRRLRLGSALVVPLQVRGRTTGVLTLVRDEEDAWADDEVQLVEDLSHRMATAVDNAVRFRRERETALTLQHSLLPRVLPELPGLRLAHRYLPGTEGSAVGGDWYDVLPLSGGLVGLVIGDVMGRGTVAAAVMGQLRAALRAYAMVEPSPAAVLGLLDAATGSLEQSEITTCLYGVLDPSTRRLRLASAGHLPPLVVHADGGGEFLEIEPGPPLGAATEPPPETEVELPEGAVLLLYTDGLVEGRTQPVEEGMLALRAAVADCAGTSAEALCDLVLHATGRDGHLDDDNAVLAVALAGDRSGPDDVHVHLAGHLSEVARARRVAVRWARAAGVDEHDVALIVTELASNALRHGGPGVDVWLRTTPGALRIELVDGRAGAVPRLRDPSTADEGGRGLVLVQALAPRWGTQRLSAGKVVWVELDRP